MIIEVPGAMPLTTPPELIEATDRLPDVHEPPLVAFASVVVPPGQSDSVPVIGIAAFTVTVWVTKDEPQVLEIVCVISAVPADTPLTTAVLLPTDATAVFDDDHVPPPTEPDSEMVKPMVTAVAPDMVPADGAPLTVSTEVRRQPAAEV